jgi:hypothetical protein
MQTHVKSSWQRPSKYDEGDAIDTKWYCLYQK